MCPKKGPFKRISSGRSKKSWGTRAVLFFDMNWARKQKISKNTFHGRYKIPYGDISVNKCCCDPWKNQDIHHEMSHEKVLPLHSTYSARTTLASVRLIEAFSSTTSFEFVFTF